MRYVKIALVFALSLILAAPATAADGRPISPGFLVDVVAELLHSLWGDLFGGLVPAMFESQGDKPVSEMGPVVDPNG